MDTDHRGYRLSEMEPQPEPERYAEWDSDLHRLGFERGYKAAQTEAASEIKRLQAENERLRKTLQVIADNPTWLDHGPRAQTALAPPPQR